MDEYLKRLVRDTYSTLKRRCQNSDVSDIIDEAEKHVSSTVRCEWHYLRGIAHALNITMCEAVWTAHSEEPYEARS